MKNVFIPICPECEEENKLALGDDFTIVCGKCGHVIDMPKAFLKGETVRDLYQEFEDVDGVLFKVEPGQQEEEAEEEVEEEEEEEEA